MIDDNEAIALIEWMVDHADGAAAAKAEYEYLYEKRHSILSACIEKHRGMSVASAKIKALTDPEYLECLDKIRDAQVRNERYRLLYKTYQGKVDAWRTLESTRRTQAKVGL